VRLIGSPVSFDGERPGPRDIAPRLGADNAAFGIEEAPP